MKYVSLHHHSTFSFLDGFALPETHVRRAAELEMSALALTEHGNVSSHVQLEKAAQKSGVRPIFGVELYCGPTDEERRGQRKNHLTVLAEDVGGYRNILQLVTRGWAEGYYYEPTVSGGMLQEHADGLVVLSGCTGSLLATSLVGGKNVAPEDASYRRARKVAQQYKAIFGDSYYLEVQAFPDLEVSCNINQAFERLSKELSIPLVATGDVHYTQPTEAEMQMILHNVRGGNRKTLEEQAQEWGQGITLAPPTSDLDMLTKLRGTGLSLLAAEQAIASTAEIADRCGNITLPTLPRLRYPTPGDPMTLWRNEIKDGWYYRGINKLPKDKLAEYRARLHYEMEVIEGKDFIDYFLVVSDVVKFAKDHGIPVGPARGSAAASLVCYLLRITEVDPLRFPTLVFERFIDTTRQDLPDIDLDFDDTRRGEIRDYLVAKYGADAVGNIGSVTQYKSKNSLDDVARAHRIPLWALDPLKERLIERSSGDLRASATIEDTVEQFEQAKAVVDQYPELYKAMELEGNIRGLGIHAAGLVLANGPLTDVCAVYSKEVPKGSGNFVDVISVDKYDAEYLNIMKIDVLSLSTMGMISLALGYLNMKLEDLYALPLDDPEVIRGFQENDVVGIFQFDGRAMRSVCGELQPDTFAEICDVCALARPGPLHNGATAEYIDVKRGRKKARRFHPLLDPITQHTNYQIVYQEQILRICMEVGGFDWTHAAYIRKIISKKLGEQEFERQFERFRQGAIERGMEETTAREIWNACLTAGSYAFNNAHTVSYGMLAFWTMWLKRYHPQAFYAASLAKCKNDKDGRQKRLQLCKDAEAHGIKVLPPDLAVSGANWLPNGTDEVRAGLIQVSGIGDKSAKAILEWLDQQEDRSDLTWDSLSEIKGIGPKTIQMIKDFVDSDDPFEIHKLEREIEVGRKFLRKYKLTVPQPTHRAVQVPYSRGPNVNVTWLGQVTHRNLKDLFELHYSRSGEDLDPNTVKDPDLREWVVLQGQDETETLTITIDRWKYDEFKEAIWSIRLNHDLLLVQGYKAGKQSRRAIYVNKLWVLNPDGEGE